MLLNCREPGAPPMQCTLLIPHLLWPRDTADTVTRGLEVPALSTLLARASVEHHPAASYEAWLCRAFEVERQQDWPIAPLTLALDGGEPGDAYWLRADPVHLKLTRDRLVLVDARLLDIDMEEARLLVDKLNAHFSGHGMIFQALHSKRWYVKLPRAPELMTHTASEVAGKDVKPHLPTGGEALAWHRIFNEAQMVLHDDPVNVARETRGEPPVNSVWFWGGGVRQPVRGRHFEHVWSNECVASALAASADITTEALPPSASAWLERVSQSAHSGSHLIVLDQVTSAVEYEDAEAWRNRVVELETAWLEPLVTAVRARKVTELTLITLGRAQSMRFALVRSDLLKLWRRPQPLAFYA